MEILSSFENFPKEPTLSEETDSYEICIQDQATNTQDCAVEAVAESKFYKPIAGMEEKWEEEVISVPPNQRWEAGYSIMNIGSTV